MQLSIKLCCLFPLLLLCAPPARADIATPERIFREKEVQNWHQQFPNLVPTLDVTLSPDAKALLLRFTFKSPASYSIELNEESIGSGKVDELGGMERTERVPFAPPQNRESSWLIEVDYTLYGVENTRFGPKLTDKNITGCMVRRFTISWIKEHACLQEEFLSTEDYHTRLRDCCL